MSNFYDNYNPDKFNFDYDNNFELHKPPKHSEEDPPFWIIGILSIFIVIWNIRMCWEKFCKKEQTVSSTDLEATYLNNYHRQMSRSMPIATIVENLRHISPAPNISNPLTERLPTTITPLAPDVEFIQPQILQPTAPRLIEDNTPKYDSPPNYDEAMTMISQQNRELYFTLSTETSYLLNETSSEPNSYNIHQPHDTNL